MSVAMTDLNQSPSEAAPMDRKALLRARFATLAAEVDSASPTPAARTGSGSSLPTRTTSDFIAEAMKRVAQPQAHPLSMNDAGPSVVIASVTNQRSRNGDAGGPARKADWQSLADSLDTVRQHPDFEECLQDPGFREAECLRSVIESFASLPWSISGNTSGGQTPKNAGGDIANPTSARKRRGALGDISNGVSSHGHTPTKAASIVRKAKIGIPKMIKSTRMRGGRSRSSAAPTRGGSDPNLEDELVSTVLADPRTNVGVSSMKCIDGTMFYGVDVIGPDQQWTVYRRYRQFEALQDSLTALGKQRNALPEAEIGSPFREADAAALLAKLLPEKTFLKANDLELAYRRVMLDAYVREVWRCDLERIAATLRDFLTPGGAQAAAGYNSPKTGRTSGWLRVARCSDFSELPTTESLPRRWVCIDGGNTTDSQPRTDPTLWYSRRPGCSHDSIIRSISLRSAVLNPNPLLRQQRAFEITTPHERVLFVAGSSAEWVHWLGVLMPLLDPRLVDTFQGVPVGKPGEEILVKASALVPDHTRKRSASFSDFSFGRCSHWCESVPAQSRAKVLKAKVRHRINPLIDDVNGLHLGDWAVGPAARAVKLCPGDASSWAARGDALARLGRRGAARADFEAALIISPDFTPAKRALASIGAPNTNEPPAPTFSYVKPATSCSLDPENTVNTGVTKLTPNTKAQARRTLSLSPEPTTASPDQGLGESPPGTPTSVDGSLLSDLLTTPPTVEREGPRLPPHSVGLGRTMRRTTRSRSRQLRVESEAVVVVDTGSACLRAGFAGEGAPRVVATMHGGHQVGRGSSLCPSNVAGEPSKVSPPAFSAEQQNFTVEWDGLLDTWEALFDQHLMIDCSEHSFVMSTLPDMTPASRSTMIETMFEHFDAPCLRTESPAVLSLHALGLRDGLVIDCGNRLSVTPIVEGYVFEQATHRSFYGGLELTAELRRRLMDSGVDAAGLGAGNFECSTLVRALKEKYCHVAPFGHAAADSLVSFKAAQRQRCIIGPERTVGSSARMIECGGAGELWKTPERLFTDLGDGMGLHQHVAAAVQLSKNVVLAGGSTCFPGFADRLQAELAAVWDLTTAAGSSQSQWRVVAPTNRRYTTWIGGSNLAQLDGFDAALLWAEDWAEHGESILHGDSCDVVPVHSHCVRRTLPFRLPALVHQRWHLRPRCSCPCVVLASPFQHQRCCARSITQLQFHTKRNWHEQRVWRVQLSEAWAAAVSKFSKLIRPPSLSVSSVLTRAWSSSWLCLEPS